MVKRKVKMELMAKEQALKMNLENNYKDLARSALEDYKQSVEDCYERGDLKEKDYVNYRQSVQNYANSMIGYHH